MQAREGQQGRSAGVTSARERDMRDSCGYRFPCTWWAHRGNGQVQRLLQGSVKKQPEVCPFSPISCILEAQATQNFLGCTCLDEDCPSGK